MLDSATITQDLPTASLPFDGMVTLLCCCSILDERLGPSEHLADCELQLPVGQFSLPLIQDTNSDCTGSMGSDSKKRKHRESMARLRRKLRDSIDELQMEERQLARKLQRTVANFKPPRQPRDEKSKLQLAHYELVKEQLALQEERRNLDKTWDEKDKYARLVQRELERMNVAAEDIDEADTEAKWE